ncbi:MAG: response regulator [Planctomycetota bacterium]|nr:MAG: response regulator [Planctomycetota bacterium]
MEKMNKQTKILIIDDDYNYVQSIRAILESKEYTVDAAHDRESAMQKIVEIKPDLILLDIMMDRLDDGFTICYKLKHDSELKKIPILTISAITKKTGFKFSPATDGEYFEADDYVEKPIKASDLLERVEKLLKR